MVPSESPSCVSSPRLRTTRFLVKILPCLYTARTRSVNEPLPWVRNTKIGNNTVPKLASLLRGNAKVETVRFPVKILVCLSTTRMRSVSIVNISLGLETPRLGIAWFLVSLPLA